MAGRDKAENFDLKYLMTLYEDLAESNKEQAKILKSIEVNVGSINTAIGIYDEKFTEHALKIKEAEIKAREVERRHDQCDAKGNIKQLWYHVKRLNAFKDMIKIRAGEDSTVIDTHAEKMQHQAELDRREMFGIKAFALKFLPWFILVFVIGISLATIVTMKALAGDVSDTQTLKLNKVKIPIIDVGDNDK
jgi:hypothetical protein